METYRFFKWIPGGNLSRLVEMKVDFPMRVKSIPAGRVEISSRQNGIM